MRCWNTRRSKNRYCKITCNDVIYISSK
jgi:hypothetical protein